MADIIRLLPDSVANQIAAGEVVQRPSSAVKELLENAVDSGATEVKLLVKDAGKMLIRVIDNGCGMSDRDARMCFERHATSKIKTADDLLAIRTLGFRGEALASISSIAQVELKTRKNGEDVGTSIAVSGSEFQKQSPVSTPTGTDISVKNLFYNVPARRNFLKSNVLELKYVMEEFNRVALVNPDITLSLHSNDKPVFQLPPSNLKQRIVNLFGNSFNQRLIPVEQETPLVNISGFIGKPEFARKTRGEQYFFANGRFIKNGYLNHAVENAFQELIPKDAFPTYFLYLEVDPQTIDINIHPTKTEINFQDAKSIYAILNSAIKQAIGKFNLSPSLDFDLEKGFALPPLPEGHIIRQPSVTINPEYNPFEKKQQPQPEFSFKGHKPGYDQSWQKLMDPLKGFHPEPEHSEHPAINQYQGQFIVSQGKDGILIIDQQHAHERILYERFLKKMETNDPGSQQLLIPQTYNSRPDETPLLEELSGPMKELGFEITTFGKDTFLIHAVPQGTIESEVKQLLESILEDYKNEMSQSRQDTKQQVAKSLSRKLSVKRGNKLKTEEMRSIVENLLASDVPDLSPDGKPTMMILPWEDLAKKFKH